MDVPFADLMSLYPLVAPFALVLFRVLGLFMFVPLFSNAAIPGNVKVLLALAISLCVWNVVPKTAVTPGLVPLALAVIAELSVGLLIGILTSLVFMGVQLGGHLLSQQMGLSMAAVYDPMFDEQSTVVEQLAFWMTLIVFFAIGGHRQLIHVLVMSYRSVPMGRGLDPTLLVGVVLASVQTSFDIAVRVAAPGLVIFFLATIASGFVSKSMPQINIMSIGLGMNLLIGMGMIMASLAGWAIVSTQAWDQFFRTLTRVFGT